MSFDMKFSGLYFIPTSGHDAASALTATLLQSIDSRYFGPARLNTWTLSHRLLRSIPSPTATPSSQSLQHILHHTSISSDRTFVYVHPHTTAGSDTPQLAPQKQTTDGDGGEERLKGRVIAIPSAQTDAHAAFLYNQLSPLWSLRQTLSARDGISLSVGQFTVSIGELRLTRATGTMTNSTVPGVVVWIATGDGLDDDGAEMGVESADDVFVDKEDMQDQLDEVMASIRALWANIKTGVDLGKAEVREVFTSKDSFQSSLQKNDVVRMWCDVLRLRG